MKIIIIRPILVGQKVLLEGEEFDAGEQHARDLLARGYAREAGEKPAGAPPKAAREPRSKAK